MQNLSPNILLFVGGAPRSGTTFLFDFLSQHEPINPALSRETYYFMDAAHPLINKKCNIHTDKLKNYRSHFFSTASQSPYLLDGTDHLLYQEEMPSLMAQLYHQKLIFIFREPARRILSSFNYTKNNLANFKKNISFTDYIQCLLQEDYEYLDQVMYHPEHNSYVLKRELKYSHYYTYLKKWTAAVGQEQIYTLQFEHFIQHSEYCLRELLDWLSIAPHIDLMNNNLHRNESITIRSKKIHALSRKIASLVPSSNWKNALKKIYFLAQSSKATKLDSQTDKTLHELEEYFSAANEQLATLIPLNLELWKNSDKLVL